MDIGLGLVVGFAVDIWAAGLPVILPRNCRGVTTVSRPEQDGYPWALKWHEI